MGLLHAYARAPTHSHAHLPGTLNLERPWPREFSPGASKRGPYVLVPLSICHSPSSSHDNPVTPWGCEWDAGSRQNPAHALHTPELTS